jgi:3-methyladenine DNA glycosylase AlkD
MLNKVKADLYTLASPEKAKILSRFFKTGTGEYGEGDVFLGITVPGQRRVARKYSGMALEDLQKLLSSPVHEHRLTALLILVARYQKANAKGKKEVYDFYLKNIKHTNNWDLVDLTAEKILGDYLLDKDKSLLYRLASSNNLWERRMAIVTTYQFIKNNQFEDTFHISEILIQDKHDLIHKAVGWMLREVGKRNQYAEEQFLLKYYKKMPRTMLRYAIEKFEEKKRLFYLNT